MGRTNGKSSFIFAKEVHQCHIVTQGSRNLEEKKKMNKKVNLAFKPGICHFNHKPVTKPVDKGSMKLWQNVDMMSMVLQCKFSTTTKKMTSSLLCAYNSFSRF